MALIPAREAALTAIAAWLAAQLPDVPVERGRRSIVSAEECPRVLLHMGGHREAADDAAQVLLLSCEATVEGYVVAPADAADPDAALEAALNELHARCAAALLGVEIAFTGDGDTVMVDGVGFEPDAAALDASAAAAGGFTWTIRFDLRVPARGGPYVNV